MSFRFKVDENLGRWLAEMLTAAGHDATTIVQQRLAGSPDAELIAVCKAEARCLVTMDAEFGNPLMFSPGAFAGIVLIRVPNPIRPEVLRAAGQTLVNAIEAERGRLAGGLAGKLWIVQPGRVRQYQPPYDNPSQGIED